MPKGARLNGNPAVMASTGGINRAAHDDDETAHFRKLSYFPTPPWAARAGAEVIGATSPYGMRDLRRQFCWEPACGRGHMVHGLADYFMGVAGSDVRQYRAEGVYEVHDFLSPTLPPGMEGYEWVVTNPPFPLAADFVRRGLEVATQGVAIFARLALLESAGRFDLMSQLTVLAPFSERVPLQLGSWDPDADTATAYAWFIFAKDRPEQRIVMIPPGTRARLTRPSDEGFADGRKPPAERHAKPGASDGVPYAAPDLLTRV